MSEPDEHTNPLAEALADIVRRVVREELQAIGATVKPQEDRMLKAREAAEILNVSEDFLYRKSAELPFTRKLAPGVLRFSSQGIQKWLSSRKTI